jgi:hypothetical protein
MNMQKGVIALIAMSLGLGCASNKFSKKNLGERVEMTVMSHKKPLTLEDAVGNNKNVSSGALITTDMLVGGVGLAVKGVQKLISKSSNNYTSTYKGATMQQYFYSITSPNNALDPNNVQFKGFNIKRSFKDKKDKEELALTATVSLDSSKLDELFLNSKFYLRLDSLNLMYSKVKVNQRKWYTPWTAFMKVKNTINLDLEIVILAKWMDKNGNIHSDQEMGKFYYTLRNAPINHLVEGHQEYYDSLRNKPLAGSSFIIPRSYASCIDSEGNYQPCFGKGEFSILVKVTESSKDAFVNTFISTNSEEVFKHLNEKEIKKILEKQGY